MAAAGSAAPSADPPRGRGRPPKVLLTLPLIVDTALALVETEGPDALTIRRLSARLGVDPSALYRHVADKDELHLCLAERLYEEVLDGFAPSADWRADLHDLAWRSRRAALRHPAVAVLATYRTTRRPLEMQIVEHILVALRTAGFPPGRAALMHRVYGDFVLAWAGMDAAYETLDPAARQGDERAWTREYPAASPTGFPAIAASAPFMASVDADEVFAEALEILLDGLAARAPGPDGSAVPGGLRAP